MFYNAKTHTLAMGRTHMDYVRFGHGGKVLVMIPGLSLRGVKGSAFLLAFMYRVFCKEYTVYIFDRKADIPAGYTVADIAEDTAFAMRQAGITRADVFGVSQGGMVAQYLAINHPLLVRKLVLGVTLCRPNPVVQKVVGGWITMLQNRAYHAMVTDMLHNMYSDAYLRRYRWLLPVAAQISKPKDPDRFITLARACLTCDTYDSLSRIQCPVLVLGGGQDKIVTAQASREIAEKLGCEIYIYDQLGHSAYEEAADFNARVLAFLQR